jgi:hypothetical protein
MDQCSDSYDSSRNTSTDLSGVAPFSGIQNLAVTETPKKSTVLCIYDVLCGKKF